MTTLIYGNGGNDILIGGTGKDELWGGAGSDTFVFNFADATSTDRVKDFSARIMTISGSTPATMG